MQNSRNRGLRPLMITIEDAINDYIVKPNFGTEYKFRFVGGDSTAELAELDKVIKEVSSFKTVHEIREDKKIKGRVEGDDIILNQYAILRASQNIQEKQLEHAFALDAINLLKELATSNNPSQGQGTSAKPTESNVSFQDVQHGFDGKTKPSDRMGTPQDGKVVDTSKSTI